jgi:hypothetical protein
MAKVDVAVTPPSSLKIITRLNERRKLSGIFEVQTPEERIQEFDLTALSSNISLEGTVKMLPSMEYGCTVRVQPVSPNGWHLSRGQGSPCTTSKPENSLSRALMTSSMSTMLPKTTRVRTRGTLIFPSVTKWLSKASRRLFSTPSSKPEGRSRCSRALPGFGEQTVGVGRCRSSSTKPRATVRKTVDGNQAYRSASVRSVSFSGASISASNLSFVVEGCRPYFLSIL